jgi:head-tail adaptor
MSIARLANTSGGWYRTTYQPDGDGASVALQGTLLARVQPVSGSERQQYATEVGVITHRVYIADTPAIESSDLIRLPDGTDLIVRIVRDIDLLGRFVTIDAEEQT